MDLSAPLSSLHVLVEWGIFICAGSWIVMGVAGFLLTTARDQFPQAFRKKQG